MKTFENWLTKLNNTSDSKETFDFTKEFESLKSKFASLQGEPIADSRNNLFWFEANSEKIKVSIVEDHSVNTKTLFKENDSNYYTRTFWNISETIKIESPQEFKKAYNEMLNDYTLISKQNNNLLYKQHNQSILQEIKNAESILENQLNQLD